MPLFLFIFHILYNIHTFIQSFIQYIYPSPFAGASLHLLIAWKLSGKTLPVVPSRESNSGLSYSKPTRYQLSHAAPYIEHLNHESSLFYIEHFKHEFSLFSFFGEQLGQAWIRIRIRNTALIWILIYDREEPRQRPVPLPLHIQYGIPYGTPTKYIQDLGEATNPTKHELA